MIKFAKPDDIPQIVSFCYKTYQGLKDLDLPKPSFDKITIQVAEWVLNDVVLVSRESEDSAKIQGVLMAERGSLWWSENDRFLSTSLFYVDPKSENRGKIAFDLVDHLKEFADDMGYSVVLDIIDKRDNLETIKKFIAMKGFLPFSVSGLYKTY
jgi:hypothetical protein